MTDPTDGLTPTEDLALDLARARSIAVFCDFDGTYSVQDVGSTLARRYLGERRVELWQRYEAGEFDPWSYNVELFTGFALPEPELHAFLETIELDPGAQALQALCAHEDIPFRILSDGFDYNLDWLQAHHGVAFDYTANHLEYQDGGWRIEPGARNEACPCGTGTCKRAIISRAQRDAFCIHIGNGRVSDLCGAEAADLAFAKESLADALRERKQAFEPFETLNDVVAKLSSLLADARALRES